MLHIALILSLSKLPALVALSCSCSYSMCTVLPIAGCHKRLPILVSSHKTMSTVTILVRNIIVKITNPFLQCCRFSSTILLNELFSQSRMVESNKEKHS